MSHGTNFLSGADIKKCSVCLHYYDEDHFQNDICQPTCNDCAQYIDLDNDEEDND